MFGIFNKKNEDVVSNNPVSEAVYFFEDYSAKTLTEERVGRKGLSLFSLKDMDVPVSGFFVICPEIYKDVVFRAFDKNIVTLLENDHLPEPKQLSEYILRTKFDALDQDDILRAYSRLSGFSDSWVSVRSSVVFPERPDVSFNGVFSTELNIRGFDNLLEAIKTVYASIFTDKLALYAKSQGINLTHLKMAVVVQKMGKSEGNMITLADNGNEIYGKVMAFTDEQILGGFELLTNTELEDVAKIASELKSGKNPMDLKKQLAWKIVSEIKGVEAADEGQKYFEDIFQNKVVNEDIPEVKIAKDNINILELLIEVSFAKSKSDARRLIEQGAVKIDEVKVESWEIEIGIDNTGSIIRAGKRIVRVMSN